MFNHTNEVESQMVQAEVIRLIIGEKTLKPGINEKEAQEYGWKGLFELWKLIHIIWSWSEKKPTKILYMY